MSVYQIAPNGYNMSSSGQMPNWGISAPTDWSGSLGQNSAPVQQQIPSAGAAAPATNNFGTDLGNLLKFGAGAQTLFNGTNIGNQQQQVADINNLSQAEYDPNNPLYKQIYGEERQQGQFDLADSINEAQKQNRKAQLLGRTPLFDPERGGETQFQALTQGYANNQEAARTRARQIIGAGVTSRQQALQSQNQLALLQQGNSRDQLAGMGSIANALPLLFKYLGG